MNEYTLCKTCAHALFVEHWGEYKCEKLGIRIYPELGIVDCKHYKEGTPKDSKERPEDDE